MNLSSTVQKTFMMLKYLLILVLITGGGIPAPLSADNGTIPVDLQAKLFLTALTYDKNLEKHDSTQLDIAILVVLLFSSLLTTGILASKRSLPTGTLMYSLLPGGRSRWFRRSPS